MARSQLYDDVGIKKKKKKRAYVLPKIWAFAGSWQNHISKTPMGCMNHITNNSTPATYLPYVHEHIFHHHHHSAETKNFLTLNQRARRLTEICSRPHITLIYSRYTEVTYLYRGPVARGVCVCVRIST